MPYVSLIFLSLCTLSSQLQLSWENVAYVDYANLLGFPFSCVFIWFSHVSYIHAYLLWFLVLSTFDSSYLCLLYLFNCSVSHLTFGITSDSTFASNQENWEGRGDTSRGSWVDSEWRGLVIWLRDFITGIVSSWWMYWLHRSSLGKVSGGQMWRDFISGLYIKHFFFYVVNLNTSVL